MRHHHHFTHTQNTDIKINPRKSSEKLVSLEMVVCVLSAVSKGGF